MPVLATAASALLTLALRSSLPVRTLSVPVFGHTFELVEPRWLCLLGLWPLLLLTSLRSARVESRRQQIASLVLRSVVLTCGIAALCQPRQLLPSPHGATVLLVDVSDSIEPVFLEQVQRRIGELCRARGQNRLSLLSFARAVHPLPLACTEPVQLTRHTEDSHTDLEAALDAALGSIDVQQAAQIVLFSDGLATLGDASRAALRAKRAGVRLLYEAPRQSDAPELAVLALTLPSSVKAGDPFPVQARVFASQPARARLSLLRDGKLEPNQPDAVIDLPAGESTFSWKSQAPTPGSALYRLELTPEGDDRLPGNNQLQRAVRVTGRPRVLIVEREHSQVAALRSLLEAAMFEVTVRGVEGAPRSMTELRGVDFYILSDVPHSALPEGAASAIAAYVGDGGGFLMAGGEQGFGLGGYKGTALGRLLPVSLERKEQHDEPTLALSLVIDKSGSMSDEKIALAKEAARATAALLNEDDFLGVIGFDAVPNHVVRLSAVRNRSAIERGIDRLKAGGGTAIFPALDAAYADLSGVRAKKKHVILLTDGQTREAGLDVLVQNMQLSDITLSTVGLGQDVSRKLLEDLAQIGHGRAYFTDDPRHVPRLFLHDTEAVSRSSAVEQPITARIANPAAFLKGVGLSNAPPLKGYVATSAKPAPAQLILQTQTGDPLLARVRVGLGWSLAFTSDLKPRWNSWFGWRDFSRLLAQLIREHMRQSEGDALPIQTRVESDRLLAELEALDEDRRFINDLTGSVSISLDQGSELERAELRLVAPGLYQANLRVPAPGSYALRAVLGNAGVTTLRGAGSLGQTVPEEYRRLVPDLSQLAALAQVTGGGPLAEVRGAFEGSVRPLVPKPRWPWLIWAALLGFVAEVAVRRFWGRTQAPLRPQPESAKRMALRDN